MKKVLLLLLFCPSLWAGDHVNILVYHHVSENTPASTSVSPQQFREHLQLLQDQGFTVVDLKSAVASIEANESVPERAIAISFDDGYSNIYENAWPLLKEFNYPFTVFVATDAIDQQFGGMLSWDQLREMQQQGVTIANHSRDHDYLVRHPVRDESWLNNVEKNLDHAQQRLISELGSDVPQWFAYPYGEFNHSLKRLLKNKGYVGFAQHSGGFWQGTDLQAIPRFAAAGIYANPKTLLTKLESKPMPVDESLLPDMLTDDQTPSLTATVQSTDRFSKALNCFIDGNWQDAQWQSENAFQLISDITLSEGRHRYNCTARSVDGNYYYWFSKPWLVYREGKR